MLARYYSNTPTVIMPDFSTGKPHYIRFMSAPYLSWRTYLESPPSPSLRVPTVTPDPLFLGDIHDSRPLRRAIHATVHTPFGARIIYPHAIFVMTCLIFNDSSCTTYEVGVVELSWRSMCDLLTYYDNSKNSPYDQNSPVFTATPIHVTPPAVGHDPNVEPYQVEYMVGPAYDLRCLSTPEIARISNMQPNLTTLCGSDGATKIEADLYNFLFQPPNDVGTATTALNNANFPQPIRKRLCNPAIQKSMHYSWQALVANRYMFDDYENDVAKHMASQLHVSPAMPASRVAPPSVPIPPPAAPANGYTIGHVPGGTYYMSKSRSGSSSSSSASPVPVDWNAVDKSSNRIKCPECLGEGKIALFISVKTCTKCGGKGTIPS